VTRGAIAGCYRLGVREVIVRAIHNRTGETIHLVWSEGSVLDLRPAETVNGPFTIQYDERRHGVIPSEDEVWVMRAPDQFKWATVLMPSD
jgi:hypothetical protein